MSYSTAFKKGMKVVVTKPDLMSYGMIGKVTDAYDYCQQVYVEFDNWLGTDVVRKLCFSYSSVENLDETNHAIQCGGSKSMAVTGNYKVAVTRFVQGTNTVKDYAFALFDNTVQKGDHALVDTSNGYHVVRIVDIVDKDLWEGASVTKEVICKVDFTDYLNRREVRKNKAILKNKMDALLKNNQELILYQAIAEKSPEMAQMLAEYQKLGDV